MRAFEALLWIYSFYRLFLIAFNKGGPGCVQATVIAIYHGDFSESTGWKMAAVMGGVNIRKHLRGPNLHAAALKGSQALEQCRV